MNGVIDIGWAQMGLAYVYVLMVLVLIRMRGISREKEIIKAALRMTLQLLLAGNLLVWILKAQNPWITVGIILIMEIFAVVICFGRVNTQLSRSLKISIAAALAAGTIFSISYFLFAVIQISPWYNPGYFIPLSGMHIGNTVTGISVAASRLITTMNDRKEQIETALMLGASPASASKNIVNEAFNAAIMPSIISMMGMGVISLPGMMTGQILAGESPLTAAKYQIAIMLGVMGSVSLSVSIFIFLACRSFFNRQAQLLI